MTDPGTAAAAPYYGIGVRVNAANGDAPSSYGHDGYIPGYRSSMRYYPDFDVAMAFQMNTEDGIWEEEAGDRDSLKGHVDFPAIRERLSAVVLAAVRLAGKHG